MPLDQVEATNCLNAITAKATYTATTTPVMGRLMSANGTATTNGTEVVNAGGSTYAAQNVTTALGTPAAGTVNNTTAITYTNMPAITTVGMELWDSNATPKRKMYGSLTASKTTALGDSLSIAVSALVATLS